MNMKKWIIAAVTCSALALGAYGGQNKNSSATNPYKVYRVGMNAEFAPFGSRTSGDNAEGFDVDLTNAMAKAGNFKMEFKHQPQKSLFLSLGNGDINIVVSGVTIIDEHKQSMDFNDPYFEITQIVLVPKSKRVASSDGLRNMTKVGVVTGQTGGFSVSKPLSSDNPKIFHFETIPPITKGPENRGLDSVVSDNAVVANYVKNNPTKGLDFITLLDFPVESYGIAVRRGDETTVKMPNDTLKKVHKSNECDKVYAKYFAKEEAKAGKAGETK